MFKRFNWYNKFGTIPSEFREAMSYEEQILWLCQQIDNLKSETANYNYELLLNKPKINGYELNGNVSLNSLGIQEKLIPGSGITISGNIISATGGGSGTTFPVKVLTQNIVLEDYQIPSLEEGLYFVPSQYNVYYDSISSNNRIFGWNDIIYWDATHRTISNGIVFWTYDTIGNKWGTGNNERSDLIPSDLFLALDGTIRDSNYNEIELLKGNYFTSVHKIYKQISISENAEVVGNYELFYFTIPAYNGGVPEYTLIFNDRQIYFYNNEWQIEYTSKAPVKTLNSNIVLLENTTLDLDSGFYKFDIDTQAGLYYHVALLPNLIINCNDDVFYFDKDLQTFYLSNRNCFYSEDTNDWGFIDHNNITNEILNDRSKIPTSKAVYDALQNVSPSNVTNLDSNIILVDNVELNIDTGFYNTSTHYVYDTSISDNNKLIGQYEMFYYDSAKKAISTNLQKIIQIEGLWYLTNNQPIEDRLSNSDSKIPTSHAVYQALQNISPSNVTTLTDNIVLLANTQISLESGFYYTGAYKIYLHSVDNSNVLIGNNEIVYVASGSVIVTDNYNIMLVDEGGTIDWIFDAHSGVTDTIVNDVTMIPNSKAVYDSLASKQNTITASTTDLTPGTSPLANGEIYVVYEA